MQSLILIYDIYDPERRDLNINRRAKKAGVEELVVTSDWRNDDSGKRVIVACVPTAYAAKFAKMLNDLGLRDTDTEKKFKVSCWRNRNNEEWIWISVIIVILIIFI